MALSNDVKADKVPFHIRTMPSKVRTMLKLEGVKQAMSMEALAIKYIVEGLAADNGVKKGGK